MSSVSEVGRRSSVGAVKTQLFLKLPDFRYLILSHWRSVSDRHLRTVRELSPRTPNERRLEWTERGVGER